MGKTRHLIKCVRLGYLRIIILTREICPRPGTRTVCSPVCCGFAPPWFGRIWVSCRTWEDRWSAYPDGVWSWDFSNYVPWPKRTPPCCVDNGRTDEPVTRRKKKKGEIINGHTRFVYVRFAVRKFIKKKKIIRFVDVYCSSRNTRFAVIGKIAVEAALHKTDFRDVVLVLKMFLRCRTRGKIERTLETMARIRARSENYREEFAVFVLHDLTRSRKRRARTGRTFISNRSGGHGLSWNAQRALLKKEMPRRILSLPNLNLVSRKSTRSGTN